MGILYLVDKKEIRTEKKELIRPGVCNSYSSVMTQCQWADYLHYENERKMICKGQRPRLAII